MERLAAHFSILFSFAAIAAGLAAPSRALAAPRPGCEDPIRSASPSAAIVDELLPALAEKPALCPELLERLNSKFLPEGVKSLCELHARYRRARERLDQKFRIPGASSRVAEAVALRFINPPDWQAAVQAGKTDPALVYEPAPSTWSKWDAAATQLDSEAALNLKEGRIPRMSVQALQSVHEAVMSNLMEAPGALRGVREVGRAVEKRLALPLDQATNISNYEFKSVTGKPLISWNPTRCLEDQSEAVKARYKSKFFEKDFPIDPAGGVFVDENGVTKQCGYIIYADQTEIQAQLERWVQTLNLATQTWSGPSPKIDPIHLAARMQRWLIGIHPFERGNGRLSRLLMDWILQSVGLPPPILTNMDADIGTSELDWGREISQGMVRTIETLERCAETPEAPVCRPVPR